MGSIGQVGGKCLGLVKLLSYGFRVPDFFVIPADTNIMSIDFKNELEEKVKKIDSELFVVRSSGTQEDSDRRSFAGQYNTELNVKKKDLYEAILRVVASSHSATVKEYAQHFTAEKADHIAVIVQKQINPEKAGVLFTRSPFSNNEIVVEEVDGLGEALVSGKVTPRHKTFSKNKYFFDFEYEKELLDAAIKLERLEGKPLDVEWAYDGNLYFLQMRPITTIGDPLPDIENKKWNLYVHRDFCRLCHSIQVKATDGDFQKKHFGISVPVFEGILLNGREFYTDNNDFLTNKVWANYDKCGFFDDFADSVEKSVKKTRKRATSLKNKDF